MSRSPHSTIQAQMPLFQPLGCQRHGSFIFAEGEANEPVRVVAVLWQIERACRDSGHSNMLGHPLACQDIGPVVKLSFRPQSALVHGDARRLENDGCVAEHEVPALRHDGLQAGLSQHLHQHVALALHHRGQPGEVAFLLRALERVRRGHLQRRRHAEVHCCVRGQQRSCQRRRRDDVADAPAGAGEGLARAEERHGPLEHPR
mmetsp:Transcript_86376/g.209386  ORF Transcript_86376/g.209386 Transcript_86376/m.209386 type:complete len:203 (-) Transcript_86376:257-865(-)